MGSNHSDQELARIILQSAYTSLSPGEEELLVEYLQASAANRAKYEELVEAEHLRRKLAQYADSEKNKAHHLQTILQAVREPAPVKRLLPIDLLSRYGWVAALLLLFVIAGILYTLLPVNQQPGKPAAPVLAVIQPGKSGAILRLADGSQVVLDSLGNGLVASQQGAQVVLNNGQLAYEADSTGHGTLVYNELSTPKGREFSLTLPDNTKVWLNSNSAIRFPTRFTADTRLVYVTGEVYFEVAAQVKPGKKEKVPFLVQVTTRSGASGIVEVLGTHFNINAYASATINTTLLEGRVRITTGGEQEASNRKKGPQPAARSSTLLSPGQQARISNTHLSVINNPDIDKVMAWRRGFFNFDDASLPEVMDELARWYDLEVEYRAGVPPITFQGELSRRMQLPSVLKALEESKVHFQLEGRKITLLPAP